MKMSDVLAFLENPEDFDVLYQGHKVRYLNEGTPSSISKFFVAGFEFRATVLVHVVGNYRSDEFSDAWETWIDSMPEIEKNKYIKAYAPNSESHSFYDIACAEIEAPAVNYPWNEYREKRLARARELLDAAVERAQNGETDYPVLIEGYEEDSSGRVKSIGHYAWMNEADLDEIELVKKDSDDS